MKCFFATILLTFAMFGCLSSTDLLVGRGKNIQSQFATEQVTYVISQQIDLKGTKLQLPKLCTLKFKGDGMFVNGTLVGYLSKIVADKKTIIDKTVTIEGSWNNETVYGEWVGLTPSSDNNKQFANLLNFCNSASITHLYTNKATYPVKVVNKSAPLLIPSYVYWHNASTIQMQGCDNTHYSIVLLNKVNCVTIDGGAFIGDVKTHKGDKGEWGHGIKCGGSTNIVLKNLRCEYCWGDGIDLIEGRDASGEATINCANVTIYNVKCLYNRRQGMSIEAAHDVNVRNSEFAYTGTPKKTAPSAGVDVEQWIANKNKVWNITFTNCSAHDNQGFDMQIEPNLQMHDNYKNLVNNIKINKCTMGTIRVQYTNDFELNNTIITKKLKIINGENYKVKKSQIKEIDKPFLFNLKKS